ncbi:hypothetical protein GF340_02360 [Candidatus Peregrinibacteria bacterium]|nr:hypothetical protein [Candidatus Peregrinibacteria bacterium]
MNKKIRTALQFIGLFSILAVITLILVIPVDSNIFQGQLNGGTINDTCKISIRTIPQNLKENKSAVLIIESSQTKQSQHYTVSASSGSLADSSGNEGAYITTSDSILSYSGGESGSKVTVQAVNSTSDCIDSVTITDSKINNCESINIESYPAELKANESAEIQINTIPQNFTGNFLIQSDSGIFTLTKADPDALGTNTNTLVTSLKKVLYNGGNAGESISIQALGSNNNDCKTTINITP